MYKNSNFWLISLELITNHLLIHWSSHLVNLTFILILRDWHVGQYWCSCDLQWTVTNILRIILSYLTCVLHITCIYYVKYIISVSLEMTWRGKVCFSFVWYLSTLTIWWMLHKVEVFKSMFLWFLEQEVANISTFLMAYKTHTPCSWLEQKRFYLPNVFFYSLIIHVIPFTLRI